MTGVAGVPEQLPAGSVRQVRERGGDPEETVVDRVCVCVPNTCPCTFFNNVRDTTTAAQTRIPFIRSDSCPA